MDEREADIRDKGQQEDKEHRTGYCCVDVLCCCHVEAMSSLYCAAVVLRPRRVVLLLR